MIMIIVVENKQAFTDDIMLAFISLKLNLYSFDKLLTVVGCGALAFVLLLKCGMPEGLGGKGHSNSELFRGIPFIL